MEAITFLVESEGKAGDEVENEGENEGEVKMQEAQEEEPSYEEIIEEASPFNELAQCYFTIEDPKLEPTYDEMVIACSSITSRSLKYLENSLKSLDWEIFPDTEDFNEATEEKPSENDIKVDLLSMASNEGIRRDSLLAPRPQNTAIIIGKLDSLNLDSLRGDDVTPKVSDSILTPRAFPLDWSKKARLTKITPLMVAAMNKNHKACKLLIEHVKHIREWDK
jgi:hypothetical protein